jgi:hypothetical protein
MKISIENLPKPGITPNPNNLFYFTAGFNIKLDKSAFSFLIHMHRFSEKPQGLKVYLNDGKTTITGLFYQI